MSDTLPPLPAPLRFTYSANELTAHWRELAQRAEPDSNNTFYGAVFASIFAIGLVVLLAQYLELISAEQLRPVLFTAYLAFYAGAFAWYGMWIIRSRQAERMLVREHTAGGAWEAAFDDGGIVWKSPESELRVAWHHIASVIATDPLVTIWITRDFAMPIPARLFADAAARDAMMAAVRARMPAKAASI